MAALHYKIRVDKYYRDVEVDPESVICLPDQPTDVSSKLRYINSDIADSEEIDADIDRFGTHRLETHPSSFTARMPNAQREIEEIRNFVNKESSLSDLGMEWPKIGLSPINEYNTEGLFDMAFPTLFPTGTADWLQPRLKDVRLNEYGLHLLKYCDKRFGKHPRFRYFVLNMIRDIEAKEQLLYL